MEGPHCLGMVWVGVSGRWYGWENKEGEGKDHSAWRGWLHGRSGTCEGDESKEKEADYIGMNMG